MLNDECGMQIHHSAFIILHLQLADLFSSRTLRRLVLRG
jgi:hypothetical protein